MTEWFNIYITRVSILLTVNNNKKPLSCLYGVVWLVPFLHDFFGSLIWVFFSCFTKFIGLSEGVWEPLDHLVRRTFIERFKLCNISLC